MTIASRKYGHYATAAVMTRRLPGAVPGSDAAGVAGYTCQRAGAVPVAAALTPAIAGWQEGSPGAADWEGGS
jgi:hypothetical protein